MLQAALWLIKQWLWNYHWLIKLVDITVNQGYKKMWLSTLYAFFILHIYSKIPAVNIPLLVLLPAILGFF